MNIHYWMSVLVFLLCLLSVSICMSLWTKAYFKWSLGLLQMVKFKCAISKQLYYRNLKLNSSFIHPGIKTNNIWRFNQRRISEPKVQILNRQPQGKLNMLSISMNIFEKQVFEDNGEWILSKKEKAPLIRQIT